MQCLESPLHLLTTTLQLCVQMYNFLEEVNCVILIVITQVACFVKCIFYLDLLITMLLIFIIVFMICEKTGNTYPKCACSPPPMSITNKTKNDCSDYWMDTG